DSDVLKEYGTMRANSRRRIAQLIEEAGWSLSMDNLFSLDGLLRQPSDIRIVEVRDDQEIIDGFTVYHVPGHSPGHICLKVGPVLFLGDHILSETTPLQIPPSMREGCGVRLYLDSLRKVAGLGEHLGLPAHEDTVYSVQARVREMEAFHYQRLVDVLNLCREEKNLFRLTDEYYQLRPETINGKTLADLPRDQQILALEEIKAHVEYLIEDGHMAAAGMRDKAVIYRAV
ncbi:MAG: MBL fold metallo-hydrolase, partial [Chloroflexi bacterium]|nr:MBL fold metallo-hydrolase [Chloroflexota bacterium]